MSGSGVHGQLVGEMIRAAVAETDPPILWSVSVNSRTFERGLVRIDFRLDVRGKAFGAAIEEHVRSLVRANTTNTVDDYRERLAHGVRTCRRSVRQAADIYLETL